MTFGGREEKDVKKLRYGIKGMHCSACVAHVERAVRSVIARHLPGAEILDGGEGTARETRRRLAELDLLSSPEREGKVTIENTSGDDRLVDLCYFLLEK